MESLKMDSTVSHLPQVVLGNHCCLLKWCCSMIDRQKIKKKKKTQWSTISRVLIKIDVLGCKKKHTKKRNISVNMGTEVKLYFNSTCNINKKT